MNKRTSATGLGVAMILSGFMFGLSVSAWAQQTDSRLYHITKSGILRVCQWPQYYAISYRNPSTGQIEGIDADLANELAKELGAKLEIVDSSFVTFIADLQTNKCDIGMFGVGATLKRAQAVEFSKPYLTVGIYAIVKKNGPIKTWADIDKPGIRVADTLGSYTEPFMRSYLKHATLHAVSAPATNEGELRANRADASVADYPSALRVRGEFDWATVLAPPQPLRETSYAYVVAPGDQIWLNYVNLFVDTVKLDGRLQKFADKHGLGPIISK
jgi:ABC-type amino acid transport substrate-binding protein